MSISRPIVGVVLVGLALVAGIVSDCKAGECLRFSDCSHGLTCVDGLCSDAGSDVETEPDGSVPDSPLDALPRDGGVDGEDHQDAADHDAELHDGGVSDDARDGAPDGGVTDAAQRDGVASEASLTDSGTSDAKHD